MKLCFASQANGKLVGFSKQVASAHLSITPPYLNLTIARILHPRREIPANTDLSCNPQPAVRGAESPFLIRVRFLNVATYRTWTLRFSLSRT